MQRGYESMLDYYERVSLQLNESLYLPAGWPVRDPYVQWCERRTSSVNSGEADYSIMLRCFDTALLNSTL